MHHIIKRLIAESAKMFNAPGLEAPTIESWDYSVWNNLQKQSARYPIRVYQEITPLIKCRHCGQWAAVFTACAHCGAPVDPQD